jgi:hypothetical protein
MTPCTTALARIAIFGSVACGSRTQARQSFADFWANPTATMLGIGSIGLAMAKTPSFALDAGGGGSCGRWLRLTGGRTVTRPDAPTQILEFTPAMRTLIEDAIEALILLLDEIDGDADLEETWDRERDRGEHGIADGDAVADYFCRVEADEQPVHLPGSNASGTG